jgi:CRISPR-associated exonuclease Cas4
MGDLFVAGEFGGALIEMYLFCVRQFWYHYNYIRQESLCDRVQVGKLIHENSYTRNRKELELGPSKIDIFTKGKILIEVKSGQTFKESHLYQTLYYLWQCEQVGIKVTCGEIRYPRIRRVERVELTDEHRLELEKILRQMEDVAKQVVPPPLPKTGERKKCKSCSYYELCYI